MRKLGLKLQDNGLTELNKNLDIALKYNALVRYVLKIRKIQKKLNNK